MCSQNYANIHGVASVRDQRLQQPSLEQDRRGPELSSGARLLAGHSSGVPPGPEYCLCRLWWSKDSEGRASRDPAGVGLRTVTVSSRV